MSTTPLLATTTPLLATRGLEVGIAGRRFCRNLDLAVRSGESWGILGVNGAGKTTLLHTLAGLRLPAGGEVLLQGQAQQRLSRRQVATVLGLLLQDSVDPFPSTVLETALIGRHPHLGPWQPEGPQDIALARTALADMELEGLEDRLVNTLSGGERRRLAIATLLTQDPALLLLDEPSNHLDLRHQVAVQEHLRRLAGQGKAVLMVLHDPNLAVRYCNHVLLLFAGGEWAMGPVAELLTPENLSRLYGHSVMGVDGPRGRFFLPA